MSWLKLITDIILINQYYTPFHFPSGGKCFTPSPLGEGWEGGNKLEKK